ncbi:EAL domain-containing protein [Alteromonadaceae bacterium BrNp21-10]|nr:EAL domain-containing protein [Alteromonadaceae bacterium BrNp21-10]
MALLIAFLLLISVLLTLTWIRKSEQDYLTQQQQLRLQDQQQYHLLRGQLQQGIESWFVSFVHAQTTFADDQKSIAFYLNEEFEFLQLQWQVNNIWLFSAETELIYASSNALPEVVMTNVVQVKSQQASYSQIQCQTQCEQFIGMPILDSQGQTLILVFSSSLLEMLASINRATGADLAILASNSRYSVEDKLNNVVIQQPISTRRKLHVQQLIQQIPYQVSVDDIIADSIKVSVDGKVFLLNLLVMDEASSHRNYLLLSHDISQADTIFISYQQRVLIISISAVLLSAFAFFALTQRFRRRLLSIANRLPLLAEKNYKDFRRLDNVRSSLFLDEIDTLQDSANLLSEELEVLDNTIAANTRELENMAMYDHLTGLPNRNMLSREIKSLLSVLDPAGGRMAVLLLDFDDFRKINDRHGHNTGDLFLLAAAKRISNVLMEREMLCRFGGDEFVIVIPQSDTTQTRCVSLAEKIVSVCHEPVVVAGQRFFTNVSIGITLTDRQQIRAEDLIRQADMAMYAAKDEGGKGFKMFDRQLSDLVLRRLEIENEVREALLNREFSFALQPQIDIKTGQLVGFEALIRWFHPERGFVAPDEFIPILENSENMLKIGYWGLSQAFSILSKLDELGIENLKVAVNLSALQFLDPDLVDFLKRQLKRFKRNPEQIELELTERTVVADIEQTLITMKQLKEIGITISIDDFGTGYSSLTYLKSMPVDIIKIDRSFISEMTADNADSKIVSSTINLVRQLGMQVVAEGVETAEQLLLLQELNCDIGQGYFIAKPIFESELYDLLPQKVHAGIWDNLDGLLCPNPKPVHKT